MKLLNKSSQLTPIFAFAFALIPAWAGAASTDPYLAYLYPSGARCGETVRVHAAGQILRGASAVLVSGGGVSGKITGYVGAGGPLTKVQQEELDRRIKAIVQQRKGGQTQPQSPAAAGKQQPDSTVPLAELPNVPELRNLEQRSAGELALIRDRFASPNKRAKPPMAESAILELTIQPGAETGNRELRVLTPAGLSNPMVFQIGSAAEYLEIDPLDSPEARSRGPLAPPFVLNGQIMPGEEDAVQLRLKGGNAVVVAVQARNLIPYLADAVPGWFQATVSIRNEAGKEIVYADDNGPDPDPVLRFTPSQDGVYTLLIKDAVYRGRWDFVYRAYVLDEAGAALQFPAGSRLGVPIAQANGTPAGTGETSGRPGALPELGYDAPVMGAIAVPGELDRWRFTGKAGEAVAARIAARQAGSPLDSTLRLADASGKQLALNDDFADPRLGLSAHHADSRILAILPSDGAYFLEVADASRRGGAEYRYSLFLEKPAPGFSLTSTRSALNILPGSSAELEVRALRLDGWEGPIAVELDGAPAGFALSGAIIPVGADRIRLTIASPVKALPIPIALRLRGRATVAGETRIEPLRPADLRMQAFGNTHLVPAEEFLVASVRGQNLAPRLKEGETYSARIAAGSRTIIEIPLKEKPQRPLIAELVEPPPGIRLEGCIVEEGKLILRIAADAGTAKREENLIVGLSAEEPPKDNTPQAPRRVPLGTLPAIRLVVE